MQGEPTTVGGDQGGLADSPWFWLLLFGVMGLVAVIVVGPRFSRRQSRLEAIGAFSSPRARRF